MKKIKIRLFLLYVVLITLFSNIYAEKTKNVLVLHSYHQGLEWTDHISEGIEDSLKNLKGIKIYYEYLDTKRNYSDDYYEQLIKLYEKKVQQISFDLIITSDNAAFDFALKNREKLYQDIPIIFCGINYFKIESIEGHSNVAGIKENADYEETLNLIPKLFPKTEKILIVLDQTLTGNSVYNDLTPIVKKFEQKNPLDIEIYRDFSMKTLEKKIENLPKNSAVYLLTVNRDNTGQFFTYKEGIERIKDISHSPIFGSWDFYLGKGIIGGMITSGYKQGSAAGTLAGEYLTFNSFPDRRILESNNIYMFDKNILNIFSISEFHLPLERTIINRPQQKTNRILIILVFILSSIVIMLRVALQIKKTNEKTLEKKIEERTEELRETNRRLRELSETDELTKLYNRRYILDILASEMRKQIKTNSLLCFTILDIDNFKQINDTYGHSAGDTVLIKVAEILKKNLCEVGRYGGEEFVAICRDKTLDEVLECLNNTLNEIRELKFDFSDSPITISGGAVMYNGIDIDSYIKKADDLLYKAKKNGKDRIEI